IAVVLGTYELARRFCNQPLRASLFSVFTPVFLISATTLMCDVMMLAFWVWAIVLWLNSIDENKHLHLALSGLLIAAASLTKYFGATLVPLLLCYSIIRKRSVGPWVVHLLIPVAFLGAYQMITGSLYGHGLLSDAALYAEGFRTLQGDTLVKGLIGVIFTGG